jgi:quercetin dioxygenase-like cupin family protein
MTSDLPSDERSGRFEDHRGVIEDLITRRIDAITEIFTKAGAVRGNHVHEHTTQFAYVVSGKMWFVSRGTDGTDIARQCGPGELVKEPPGIPHAWRAVEDTTVLVFTRGPRSGTGYESDTERLSEEDKLL